MIDDFKNEHGFLSNFYVSPFTIMDIEVQTSENLYQALKTKRDVERINVLKAETPGKAKRMGRNITLRDGWDDLKVIIMKFCIDIKFKDMKLMKMLIDTYPNELVEGNYWHDNYWGNCKCKKCVDIEGINMLGCILMKKRDEIMKINR